MISKIVKLRKDLHRNPELSGFEIQTSNRIKVFLNQHAPPTRIIDIGHTGFAAIYKFSETVPTIAFRCELDALPIQEENGFEHRSVKVGIAHKCGHDGHMAIVVGLICSLKKQTANAGMIVLIFQAAEETGKGAFEVINNLEFQALDIDYVFALHNSPGESMNTIITTPESFSAEVISFSLHLVGKACHAAEPEKGKNPAIALSRIIAQMSELENIDPYLKDFALLTPVYINMGQKAYGLSPAMAELHYTLRTWTSTKMEEIKAEIQNMIINVCNDQLQSEIEWFEHFPASKNDAECSQLIRNVALENGFEIVDRPYPFKFGEDFGWFSKNYKTAMFGLGAGIATPNLHSTDYDFPDEIIETGIMMFRSIVEKVLDTSFH